MPLPYPRPHTLDPVLRLGQRERGSEASERGTALVPKNGSLFSASGNIEPLIGLETTKEEEFGAEISASQICWTPGTKFSNDHTFVKGEKGIWKSKS